MARSSPASARPSPNAKATSDRRARSMLSSRRSRQRRRRGAANRDTLTFLTTLGQQVRNEPVLGRITMTADLAVLRSTAGARHRARARRHALHPGPAGDRHGHRRGSQFRFVPVRERIAARRLPQSAGGITQSADRRRTFIILPDGTAQPVQSGWFSYSNVSLIPPGSTVVVPRDLSPFDLGLFLRDATQITSQLAVTAASVAVVGR